MATNKKKKPVAKRRATQLARAKVSARRRKPLVIAHKHSFKLVHHSNTNYALMVFMLLLVGIFCSGWTALARGEAYDVNAVVPAPPLPTAATIDAPLHGASFKQPTITVSGSCPNNSYVKLSRNNVFSGAALCQSDNTWSIQTQLAAGSNRLDAQDYNITDQAGPDSNAVTVTYTPPVVPVEDQPSPTTTATEKGSAKNTDEPASTESPSATPLIIDAKFTYNAYYTRQLSDWPLSVSGGSGPYAVQIDWGDGETSLKSLKEAGGFDLQHEYATMGDYKNSYQIKVSVTDADGHTGVLQLFTIISSTGTGNGSSGLAALGMNGPGGTGGTSTGTAIYHKFIQIAGPTYAVTLVAAASFWLGEVHQVGAIGHSLFKLHRPHRWRF